MQRHRLPLRERLVGVARGIPGQAPPMPEREGEAPAEPVPPSTESLDNEAIQGMLQSLTGIANVLRDRRQHASGEIAQASVELAVALAERLIGAAIASDRQRLDRIVRAALERVAPNRALILRGHPDDIALVTRQIKEHPDWPLARQENLLSFQADDCLPRGQIKLEGEEMFVEYDTQRCLTELRNVLLETTVTES